MRLDKKRAAGAATMRTQENGVTDGRAGGMGWSSGRGDTNGCASQSLRCTRSLCCVRSARGGDDARRCRPLPRVWRVHTDPHHRRHSCRHRPTRPSPLSARCVRSAPPLFPCAHVCRTKRCGPSRPRAACCNGSRVVWTVVRRGAARGDAITREQRHPRGVFSQRNLHLPPSKKHRNDALQAVVIRTQVEELNMNMAG